MTNNVSVSSPSTAANQIPPVQSVPNNGLVSPNGQSMMMQGGEAGLIGGVAVGVGVGVGMGAKSDGSDAGGGPAIMLTIRLIMQGKEVGSIIGKKGDNIKKFREESGAKINISDGSCPERIVTVTGSTEAILKAFSLISRKFAEDTQQCTATMPKPQVTLRLIVPASQCGSLIGKGGSKIKEIREITGATIQVASEMLPNSTERSVTVSGCSDSITKCIYQICCVMMECPPKGATIPYRPTPVMAPVVFAGGQAYTIQGQYAIPHVTPTDQYNWAHISPLTGSAAGTQPTDPTGAAAAAAAAAATALAVQASTPLAPPPTSTGNGGPNGAGPPPGHHPGGSVTEMSIPNDFIGCIIGKGGAKINEIRQLSGATIKISNTGEGSKERAVSISGSPEAVNLAQYLINTSYAAQRNLLALASTSNPGLSQPHSHSHSVSVSSGLATLPAASFLTPEQYLMVASGSTGLGSLATSPLQGKLTTKLRAPLSSVSSSASALSALSASQSHSSHSTHSHSHSHPHVTMSSLLHATLFENGKSERKFAPY